MAETVGKLDGKRALITGASRGIGLAIARRFAAEGASVVLCASRWGATGGGMSTNLYAGGVFELAPDEALIIENHIKLQPQYVGFQLANLWGESIEYANQQGSLNGHQMHVDADGVIRLVVAHRDPGVANWLDTSGHPEGFMSPRWAYSEMPSREDWPRVSAKKVPFSEIREHLPGDTAMVSAQQRLDQISVRQRHVQRRFRVF